MSAEQIVLLGDLFDIDNPGKYRAKVKLWNPQSNQLIESNLISFDVEETASPHALPKQPPFIVTLQPGNFPRPDPSNVLVCMSNLSDRDIDLDNVALKDFVSVEAPDGTVASMTEAAQKEWNPESLKRVPAGLRQYNTWWTVKPRKALCGGLTVGAIFDLSKPGVYRVRVDRYDEPDARPGDKLADLPIIHSNWLTIFENHKPALINGANSNPR